ncbi:MAG: FAD-dependent oxidoreductase [Chloroflexi bacterium]|nr:FAD-dependent oxidoreductase [Chloroflexota bacterium]
MTSQRTVPVLIAGGGPVGLTLALDLAWRGVRCMVVEQRATTTDAPKCTLTNTRSMEHFRRLGLAGQIREAGISGDYPNNIVFATRLSGYELTRFSYVSRHEAERMGVETAFGSRHAAEQPQRISQIYLEPVLKRAAEANPLVDVRFGWRLESFEQDEAGVTAQISHTAGQETVRAAYLAGCDGGGSGVRRVLGIEMQGQQAVTSQLGIFFRSGELRSISPHVDTAITFLFNPDVRGTLVSVNGEDLFTLHVTVPPGVDLETLDPRELVRKAAGCDFAFEVLRIEPWRAHLVVAERYRAGRVFLAGDAAHLLIPTGGFGMNTGIGDAMDLSWMLAATLERWGGPGLLWAYEAERRPVAERTVGQSAANARGIGSVQAPEVVESDGPEGANVRRVIGERIEANQRMEFESAGVQLGYRYDDSPIVVSDGTPAPPDDDVRTYVPTSRPGSRAPHAWLRNGRSTLDLFGGGYALLRFDPETEAATLAQAADARGVPFTVVDIDEPQVAELYERRLVLVRPDGHVAWRGDDAPRNAGELLDTVRGG